MSILKAEYDKLKLLAEIEKQVIVSIEQTNWTDTPLTDQEKHVIGMGVTATYHNLLRRGLLK